MLLFLSDVACCCYLVHRENHTGGDPQFCPLSPQNEIRVAPTEDNLVDMVWLSYGRPDPPSCEPSLRAHTRSSSCPWPFFALTFFVLYPQTPPPAEIWVLDTKYAGSSVNEKLTVLRKELVKENCPALILSALDQIAWLFNLRGSDIKFNPGMSRPLSYVNSCGD